MEARDSVDFYHGIDDARRVDFGSYSQASSRPVVSSNKDGLLNTLHDIEGTMG